MPASAPWCRCRRWPGPRRCGCATGWAAPATPGSSEPLDLPQRTVLPARDPFPGSAGFSIEYGVTAEALPAWPLLRAGFIGAPRQSLRRLGIAVPVGPRGGPVFDAAGRLAGIAVPAMDTDGDLLVPASVLRRELGEWVGQWGEPEPSGPPAQKALDEIYEHALPLTLQLLVDSDAAGTCPSAPSPEGPPR
jgi:hypothetical protein